MPAAQISPQTNNYIAPARVKTTPVATPPTKKPSAPIENSDIANIKRKLNVMYSFIKNMSAANLDIVKAEINNFLAGGELKFHYGMAGTGIKNEALTRALFNIYVNTTDTNLKIKSKQVIKDSLDPLLNTVLTNHILMSYNHSEYGEFPITKIDPVVKSILKKTFEYYFAQAWDGFIAKNIGPDNTFRSGNFIGLIYDMVTGKNGIRNNSGFGYFYNSYMRNPSKYTQAKAEDPSKAKLDKSRQSISDIIKYIYGVGGKPNPARMDAFDKANKEIFNALKNANINSLLCKAFDYIVGSRLDAEEIVDMDNDFANNAAVTSSFARLQGNKNACALIDSFYKMHKLELPPFANWKSSDINKGPSDRGELKPEAPEIDRDDKGNLGKAKYNNYGEKTVTTMNELRLLIRKMLNETYRKNNLL